MEWLSQWVRNLAFYFIFLSVLMNVIPQGEKRKYIRFFMGLLLILVLIQPLLTAGQLEQILSWETLSEGIRQEYEDFSMEKKYLEQEGKDYVQKNCQKEMERQIKTLLEQLSYESTEVRVDFFNGEKLDVKEIRCVIRRADGNPPGEGEPDQVKRKLAQVYNLPEGNINIKIQEQTMKERVFAAVREMKREQWLICGLAGLLLLVIAAPVKQKEKKKTQEKTTVSQTQEQTDDQIRQSYEKQLESVLSQVEGVGAVQVAVAMESTGKKQVEKDSPEDTSTSSEKGDSGTQRSSQTVTTGETTVYEDTGDGGQTPYISSSTYPEIRGVIVVAQGGGNPAIVQQIQEAVIALFHVEAHEIKVLKMK